MVVSPDFNPDSGLFVLFDGDGWFSCCSGSHFDLRYELSPPAESAGGGGGER